MTWAMFNDLLARVGARISRQDTNYSGATPAPGGGGETLTERRGRTPESQRTQAPLSRVPAYPNQTIASRTAEGPPLRPRERSGGATRAARRATMPTASPSDRRGGVCLRTTCWSHKRTDTPSLPSDRHQNKSPKQQQRVCESNAPRRVAHSAVCSLARSRATDVTGTEQNVWDMGKRGFADTHTKQTPSVLLCYEDHSPFCFIIHVSLILYVLLADREVEELHQIGTTTTTAASPLRMRSLKEEEPPLGSTMEEHGPSSWSFEPACELRNDILKGIGTAV
ncbi:unnamed protein product, partial [Gadus morhua 'NCC']